MLLLWWTTICPDVCQTRNGLKAACLWLDDVNTYIPNEKRLAQVGRPPSYSRSSRSSLCRKVQQPLHNTYLSIFIYLIDTNRFFFTSLDQLQCRGQQSAYNFKDKEGTWKTGRRTSGTCESAKLTTIVRCSYAALLTVQAAGAGHGSSHVFRRLFACILFYLSSGNPCLRFIPSSLDGFHSCGHTCPLLSMRSCPKLYMLTVLKSSPADPRPLHRWAAAALRSPLSASCRQSSIKHVSHTLMMHRMPSRAASFADRRTQVKAKQVPAELLACCGMVWGALPVNGRQRRLGSCRETSRGQCRCARARLWDGQRGRPASHCV